MKSAPPAFMRRTTPAALAPRLRSMLVIAVFLVQVMPIVPVACRLVATVVSYAPNATFEVEDTRQVADTVAVTWKLPFAVAAGAADGRASALTAAAIAAARAKKRGLGICCFLLVADLEKPTRDANAAHVPAVWST